MKPFVFQHFRNQDGNGLPLLVKLILVNNLLVKLILVNNLLVKINSREQQSHNLRVSWLHRETPELVLTYL